MVTLAQLKETNQDKLCAGVIEEFQRNSVLMDAMEYDDAVGVTGGSTLTYGYFREKTASTAGVRGVNSEYTASESEVEKITTDLAIMGGSYKIDRVIARASEGAYVDQVVYQAASKVKATKATFSDMIINGDKNTDANGFDGLDVILTGSNTEVTSAVNLSTSAQVDANANALVDEFEEVIKEMDGAPDFILANSKMIAKIKAVARRTSQYQETKDEFGRNVEKYGDAILVDMGKVTRNGNEEDIIKTTGGKTDVYFVRLGMDGFHGITLRDGAMISANAPDYNTAGAVKEGDVELVAGIALKNTRAAGVLRGVTVSA